MTPAVIIGVPWPKPIGRCRWCADGGFEPCVCARDCRRKTCPMGLVDVEFVPPPVPVFEVPHGA